MEGFAIRALRAAVAIAALVALSACGSPGKFVWYHDLPKQQWADASGEYVIGIGDSIRIQVYEQEALSSTAKIRPDGRIALPFVGEIVAAGKHPQGLAKEIEARLKEFIVSPRVIVNIEDAKPVTVTFLGEVGHVGQVVLDPSLGLLQAIAQAGGPNPYADKDSIYVLRRTPEFIRIRFTYDALVQNEGGAASFPLRTGDVIVVE